MLGLTVVQIGSTWPWRAVLLKLAIVSAAAVVVSCGGADDGDSDSAESTASREAAAAAAADTKADEAARAAVDAKSVADVEAQAAADAKTIADAEAQAAADAKTIADVEAQAAADAKTIADVEAQAAADAAATARTSEEKAAADAKAKVAAEAARVAEIRQQEADAAKEEARTREEAAAKASEDEEAARKKAEETELQRLAAEQEAKKTQFLASLGEGIAVYAGAGRGIFSGDGGPAVDANLEKPFGIALDSQNNLFIATGHRVRRVEAATGIITTVAGTGSAGYTGDGGPATEAKLKSPEGLAIDGAGNLYITTLQRVRKVDAETGVITTVAGGGIPAIVKLVKYPGEDIQATDSWMSFPTDVAVDIHGNIYFTANNRVRKVDAETGIVATLAGWGTNDLSGDGGPASEAGIADPQGVDVDDQGNVYFADSYNQRIRRIDGATGIITTLAGIGKFAPATHPDPTYVIQPTGQGFSGDGGPADSAMLATPTGVAVGPDGSLYVADTDNDRIRKIDLTTGIITTLADGGAKVSGLIQSASRAGNTVDVSFEYFGPPVAIAVTEDGIIFLSDPTHNRIVSIVP